MRHGVGDLLHAGVRRDDLAKEPGERDRGLSAARGAVPRNGMTRRNGGQVVKKLGGISGAALGVQRRLLGKLIAKRHTFSRAEFRASIENCELINYKLGAVSLTAFSRALPASGHYEWCDGNDRPGPASHFPSRQWKRPDVRS